MSQLLPNVPATVVTAALGETLLTEAEGDCCPIAILSAAGIIQDAANPTSRTQILALRNGSVDVITGKTVGGVDGRVWRKAEKLKVTPSVCEREMKPWRTAKHWRKEASRAHEQATFIFGCALHLNKEIVVLEKDGENAYKDPARIYGMRNTDGSLRRTPPEIVTGPRSR